MKRILLLFGIVIMLSGCVKNEDFSKTCTEEITSEHISDNTQTLVIYDHDDNLKEVTITKTYEAIDEDGVDTLQNIKEAALVYNEKYAGASGVKITVSVDEDDKYELKYYLTVPELTDEVLEEFDLMRNAINYLNSMQENNVTCE